MCRLIGKKPSPFIVGLCDPCGDHFSMLDCPTSDVETLKAGAEARLDEVEQMRQKCGGGWKQRRGKSRIT